MNSEQGYLNKSLAEQNTEWRMKQSNSVSINITVTYIVKEHRHIHLYFYTHHLAHMDAKLYEIATPDAVCSLCLFLLYFILSHI